MRSMSTGGERAVGQRPDYRRQQPTVFDRQVILVKIDQGVAYDDRAAINGAEQLGDVGVLAAADFGGGGLNRDAGLFTAVDLGGEQAVASSRWPDTQIGTTDCGSGIGPSTSTSAPVPRISCTRWVRPLIHAGSYAVKPDE
jgi:hypothetical protein